MCRPSDNDLIPSFYRRYVDDSLAIMPGLDAAESFLDVLNELHPSVHFTMELSNNDSISFIGKLITKNGNKLETQVYRKPTHTGFLRNISKTSAGVSSGFQTRETFELTSPTKKISLNYHLNKASQFSYYI